MKKTLIQLIALGACVFAVTSAQAGVTSWTDFTTSGPYGANALGSDFNSASITASGSHNQPATGGNPNSFLRFTGGDAMNSSSIILTLTASGLVSLSQLSFDYNRSGANSITSIAWTYTVSGGGSGSLGATGVSGSSWNNNILSLSGIGSVSSGATVTLTGVFSGATVGGTTANIGFDNINITAVPEPTNYALAGFGLIFVVGGAGRFYINHRRSTTAT